jgi:imidazolonepropionase-like amidohydrolase
MHAEHIELFSRKLVAANFEDLQAFTIQYQMHAPTVSAFANAILSAEDCLKTVIATGLHISTRLEGYYKALNHRHSSEGIEIHVDPITTDLAMSIYENVDSHGEIQDGKKVDEISVYTIRKAELLTEAIKTGLLGTFARDPSKFIQFIEDEMGKLWESGKSLSTYAKIHADKIRRITKFKGRVSRADKGRFEQAMIFIRDLNPSGITYKEKTGLLTIEERHELGYKNETLRAITRLIAEGAPTAELLQYILGRKQELREYHLEENSFFVCKIGSGNAFTGDARVS